MARCSKKLLRSENALYNFNKEKFSWEKARINNNKNNLFTSLLDLGTHSTCKRMSQKVAPISFRKGFSNSWDSLYFNSYKQNNPVLKNSFQMELFIRSYIKSIFTNLNLFLNKIQINKVKDTFYIQIFFLEKDMKMKRKVLIKDKRARLFKALKLLKDESVNDKTNTSQLVNPFYTYKKAGITSSWSLDNEKLINHLEERLTSFFKKDFKISFNKEIDLANSPTLFTNYLVNEIENSNVSFKGALTRTFKELINTKNIKGIRINCSGRLGRAPMAKTEWFKYGQIPLNTVNAKLEYSQSTAFTKYGSIGVKVWIYYK